MAGGTATALAEAPEQIAIAPLLVALAAAILTLALRRFGRLQVGASLLGGVGYLVAVAVLFERVRAGDPIAYQLSAWPAPFGITVVADELSVLMLALAAVVSLGALVFSVVHVAPADQRFSYHTLYHFMIVGVSGAFLTGDIFNLFVWFEVMLMASYVLVVFYSGPEQTRAALQYVVLNLIGSAVMLLAIGGIYATAGTLNMADLARRLAAPAEYGIAPDPILGLSMLLFAVFALKGGIVPFHFWVPAAYRAAPAPIAAVLAGVVKKVGIYAIIRLYFTVFGGMPVGELPFLGSSLAGLFAVGFYAPVFLILAAASILLGGVLAVSQSDIDGLLAYSSIGQIGFVVLPLGIAATVPVADALTTLPPGAGADTMAIAPSDAVTQKLAITAALIYALHHGVAKSLLFLVSGAINDAVGTTHLPRLGGLTERTPVLSGAFLVGAFALIGVPPLFGFFGKFLVFDALSSEGATPALAAATLGTALLGAVLTIAYVTRAWNRGFWGDPGETVGSLSPDRVQVAVIVGFAALVIALGVGVDPVIDAARGGAEAALDREGYVEVVDPQVAGNATATGGGE
ncbi:MAG: complex I subunit 5 family protein [Halobacteriales archaeon]